MTRAATAMRLFTLRRPLTAAAVLALQVWLIPARAWAQAECPSANVNDVLNDPRVQEALDQAWRDSQEGTESEHEEGGYIQQCQNRNAITGEVTYFTQVLRWPPGDRDSSSPAYPPRQDDNCRTVATFHTHPGGEPGGPGDDGYTNPIPSPEDYLAAGNDGLPGIIRWGTGDDTNDFTYNYGTVGDGPREPGWVCPGAPPPASGFGDPHLLTLDGLAYDFMAIGDFVLMRASRGAVEMQARLQPYGKLTSAAVTTGIAVRDGRDRVEWQLDGRQLLVNGVPRPLERGASVRLRSRALLRNDDQGLLLVSSVGDRLRVVFGYDSLDYSLAVASHRAGTLSGLFGNFDGDPDNDLRSADGQVVSHSATEAPDYQRPLYTRFGESWRVAASATIFATPYQPPATIDVKTFPHPAAPPSAEARATAEAACKAAGVSDAVILGACVFDYLQSGGTGFTAAAARADRDIRTGTPLAVSRAIVVERDVVGRLEATTREVTYPLTLAAGTYLFDPRGSRATVWRVLNASGNDMLAGMNEMESNPRRVTLPGGPYRLIVSVVPEATAGRFRFRVRKPADPEVSTLLPGVRATGRIEAPGQIRSFLLRLEAGRYDFVPQSTGELWWSLTGSDGSERFDANQRVFMERAAGVEITKAGTYTLSVAGREWAGTGSYDVGFTRTP